MNRTRGFVNVNRFKSGKAIKRLSKVNDGKGKKRIGGKNRRAEKAPINYDFGA